MPVLNRTAAITDKLQYPKSRQSFAVSLACLLALVPHALTAHDLYILPSSFHPKHAEHLRVSFRNGDSFPASEVAPLIARLLNPRISSSQGQAPVLNLHVVGKETVGEVLVPAGGDLVLSVSTAPNLIELEPEKFLSYLQEEGLDQVIRYREEHRETARPGRERYQKFAKSLLQSATSESQYGQPIGFPIEFLALADPAGLHQGDKLPVRLLLRGKPAAGLAVEAARANRDGSRTSILGRTDRNGEIEVPLDRAGQWRLHSLYMERCSDTNVADWESFWASLTFEVPAHGSLPDGRP